MSLLPMYPGREFTPYTTLLQGVNAAETRIHLAGIADDNGNTVFPTAPNYASIFVPGTGTGEVVRYVAVGSDSTGAFIDAIRGESGTAQDWPAGTRIGRYFTARDLEALHGNFAIVEDKLTLTASCVYDETENVYILRVLNIPATIEAALPEGLPDLFPVTMRTPNDYEEEAKFRIGTVDFAPKYAAFEENDVVCVYFDKLEGKCFFRVGGGAGSGSLTAYCGNAYAGYSYMVGGTNT